MKRRSLAQVRAEAEAACTGQPRPTPKARKPPRHVEDDHQAALFEWVDLAHKQEPRLALLHAIPNGGKRNKFEAARMKAQGVRPGVPDLHLPVAWTEPQRGVDVVVAGYLSLYIELKRPIVKGETKPVLEPEQVLWCGALQAVGHCVCVCFGWEQARDAILYYLAGAAVPHQYQATP